MSYQGWLVNLARALSVVGVLAWSGGALAQEREDDNRSESVRQTDDENQKESRRDRSEDRDSDERGSRRDNRDEENSRDRSSREDRATREREDRNERSNDRNRDDRDSREHLRAGIALNDDSDSDQLMVGELARDSLAYRSGLRENDRVVSINNRTFRNPRQFWSFWEAQAGRRVPVIIDRDGQRYTVTVSLPHSGQRQQTEEGAWLGISLDEREENGARVSRVYQNSPAARAGFRVGDLITAVDSEEISDADEFIDKIEDKDPRDRVHFTVERNNRDLALTATLADRQSMATSQSRETFYSNQAYGNQGYGNQYRNDQRYSDQQYTSEPRRANNDHDRRLDQALREIRELRNEVRDLRDQVERR